MSDPDGITAKDVYASVADEIAREDRLLGERTGWLIVAHGILFAALGLINESENIPCRLIVHWVLPSVGFFSAFAVLVSSFAAVMTLFRLRARLRDFRAKNEQQPFLSHLPLFHTDSGTLALGLLAPLALPFIFLAAWLATHIITEPPLQPVQPPQPSPSKIIIERR